MSATSLAHAVDAALTPDLALRYLRELAADLVAAVVLRADGAALAGPAALATAAADLLPALGDSSLAQARTDEHVLVAGRSASHLVLAVHTRFALPGLVRHDVASVLEDLADTGAAADGAPGAGRATARLADVAPLALDPALPGVRAALRAARSAGDARAARPDGGW